MNHSYRLIQFTMAIGLIGLTLNLLGQTQRKIFNTSKYSGIYSFGENAEKGPVGRVTIYPESDSTVLFYIDICKGAPSYNLGQLYSRLEIKNDSTIYYLKYDYSEKGCKWKVTVNNNLLTIKTLDDCYECGFGANVIADNEYIRKENVKPEYFIDGHNRKVFFDKTNPENYYRK